MERKAELKRKPGEKGEIHLKDKVHGKIKVWATHFEKFISCW